MTTFAPILALSVLVEAGSSCPTAAQIQEQIKVRLEENGLRGRLESAEPDRVWVEAGPVEVSVELRQSDGTLIGNGRLPADRNCLDLAKAIATQVAAWELSLAPSDLGPLPPPLPQPSPSSSSPLPVTSPVRRWRIEPGMAVRSYVTAFVPALSLETTLRNLAYGIGGRLSFNGTLPQRTALSPLDPGEVEWHRLNAGFGPSYNWEEGHLFMELHAALLLGVLQARGIGWETNWSRSAFDPGFAVGFRAGFLWKQFRFWIDSTLVWWPARHGIIVERVAQLKPVDQNEPFISVGTTFLSGW